MALDKYVAEKRQFARLLGTDGEAGSGLPIGSAEETNATARATGTTETTDDERPDDAR